MQGRIAKLPIGYCGSFGFLNPLDLIALNSILGRASIQYEPDFAWLQPGLNFFGSCGQ